MGNCGSPIEIDEGWLVITHGVGSVRNYCIGACLLDRDDPSKVLGRTTSPLIRPSPEQRYGFLQCGLNDKDIVLDMLNPRGLHRPPYFSGLDRLAACVAPAKACQIIGGGLVWTIWRIPSWAQRLARPG